MASKRGSKVRSPPPPALETIEIHLKRDRGGSFGIFFDQATGAIRGVSKRDFADARTSLKVGDHVIRVGGMPVRSIKETIDLMRRADSVVYITVRRGALHDAAGTASAADGGAAADGDHSADAAALLMRAHHQQPLSEEVQGEARRALSSRSLPRFHVSRACSCVRVLCVEGTARRTRPRLSATTVRSPCRSCRLRPLRRRRAPDS